MEELVTVELYKHAQFSERVGLRMRYNLDTFHYLRDKIPFPRYMYDAEKKLWSIDASPETINDACELLDNLGYDTSIVRTYTKSFSKNQQNKSNCWVKKKRTRLYLHWPFIRDEGLRNKVRLTVRSVSGWKFHADDKCWSIPIAQASTLYSMLADFYEPLAEAIRTDKSVKEEISDSITRVEMSGAIELDGSDLADIDSRLTGKFPEGLDLYPFQKVAVAFAEASKGRCLIGDEMGIGKAQPLTSMLLTPNGWKAMGEVQEGDEVIGSNGQPTTVMGIYPQGKKSIYKVTFSDGTSTECCGEHLWTVTTPNWKSRGVGWKTMTLDQMVEQGIRAPPSGGKGGRQGSRSKGNRKWFIPVMESAEFPKVEQPLDPYTLGALLGDGGIKYQVIISSVDQEVLDRLVLPKGLRLRQKGDTCDYGIARPREEGKHENEVKRVLRDLGLFGKGSLEKFVPDCYKFADKQQRLEVLRGLMDTDGTVNKQNGQISFTSISEQLTEDVAWLVRSLGGVARIKPRTTHYTHNGERKQGKLSYRVSISVPNDLIIFHLPRKLSLIHI